MNFFGSYGSDDHRGTRKLAGLAIEANGGVLEDRRGVKLRYWIPTTPRLA
jgi:hypothetical protein